MSIKYKNHELESKGLEVFTSEVIGKNRCAIRNITDNLYFRSSDTFDDANVKKTISRWVESLDAAWIFSNFEEARDCLENTLNVHLYKISIDGQTKVGNVQFKEHDPLDRFKALEI